ncbi:MAG: hypothetical protein IJ039_07335 [Clostridia bacterium]|nr:hypothetical protein [Clostridia bacterium]
MKKFIAILCLAFLIMAFCACGNENVPNSSQSSANNTDVDDSQNGGAEQPWYTLYKSGEVVALQTEKFECDELGNCLKIPVVPVLRGLGADIEWVSDTVATVVFQNITYTLDTEQGTMIENGSTESIFHILPPGFDGGRNYPEHIDGKGENFSVDYYTFRGSLIVRQMFPDWNNEKIFFLPNLTYDGYNLRVNGTSFADASIVIHDSGYPTAFAFSLNDILMGCGFDIEWVSTLEAVASKNGKEYLINYSEYTFTEKGTEKNLLDILDN